MNLRIVVISYIDRVDFQASSEWDCDGPDQFFERNSRDIQSGFTKLPESTFRSYITCKQPFLILITHLMHGLQHCLNCSDASTSNLCRYYWPPV